MGCPVVQAPMSGYVTAALVAEVGKAGAVGFLAAARMSREELAAAIDEVRDRTAAIVAALEREIEEGCRRLAARAGV